jgi:hypothetical protein
MPITDTSSTLKPIAIQVWEELQRQLKREKSPYLDRDRFVLQKDAYIRLADEDVEHDVPFLSYEHNEPTHDEALDFSLYFFQYFFSLSIGPTTFDAPYEGFAADAESIARDILLTIKYLLGGQIALGCTFKGGRLLAVETFVFGLEDRPYPIAIAGNFSLFRRSGPDFLVKRNKLLTAHLKVDEDYPLLPPIVNGARVHRGRRADDIYDLEPLTKKEFDALATQINAHEFAGKPADQKSWRYLYGTIDFWLVAAVVLAGVFALKYAPFTPAFLRNDWLQPLYIIGGWYLISALSGYLLGLRQARIDAGHDPLTARIERQIGKLFGRGR